VIPVNRGIIGIMNKNIGIDIFICIWNLLMKEECVTKIYKKGKIRDVIYWLA
jgi:hypothetical protein